MGEQLPKLKPEEQPYVCIQRPGEIMLLNDGVLHHTLNIEDGHQLVHDVPGPLEDDEEKEMSGKNAKTEVKEADEGEEQEDEEEDEEMKIFSASTRFCEVQVCILTLVTLRLLELGLQTEIQY